MNARLYDPVLGRMLSPDNYVGEGTQGFNRYSYANNNPLKFVDPDGNFAFEIAKFAGHAISTAVGVGLNAAGGKYNHKGGGWQALGDIGVGLANGVLAAINPLDFSFGDFATGGVSLRLQSGTDGIGLGVEAGIGLGYGNHRFVEAYAGVNVFSSAIGTNRPTLEGYIGAGIGWKVLSNSDPANGGDSYSDEIASGIMLRSTIYFSGETSQRLGGVAFLFPTWGRQGSVSYENDGVPFGFGAGDNGDSYRTASVNIKVWDFEAGFNLFTGYRDLLQNGDPVQGYPHGIVPNPEANMYRAGIAYLGYKGYRVGMNSEQIRHIIQNKFAHGIATQQDWFKITNLYNGAYVRHGQGSRYTNW